MKRSMRWLYGAGLILPLGGYLAAIASAELARAGAPTVVLPIEGFDPRDPLRGHYLQYRFSFDGVRAASPEAAFERPDMAGLASASVCVAREEAGEVLRAYEPHAPAPAQCVFPFPVDFASVPHRFYVQQDRASDLEDAVREGRAAVRVRLISETRVAVDELLIDGEPWGAARPD